MQNINTRLEEIDVFLKSVPHFTFQALMERIWYIYQHFDYLSNAQPQIPDFHGYLASFDQLTTQTFDFISTEMVRDIVSRFCTGYFTQLGIQSLDSRFCELVKSLQKSGHQISLKEWDELELIQLIETDNSYLVDIMDSVLEQHPESEITFVLGIQKKDTFKVLEEVEKARGRVQTQKANRVLKLVSEILKKAANQSPAHSGTNSPKIVTRKPVTYGLRISTKKSLLDKVRTPTTPLSQTPPVLRSPAVTSFLQSAGGSKVRFKDLRGDSSLPLDYSDLLKPLPPVPLKTTTRSTISRGSSASSTQYYHNNTASVRHVGFRESRSIPPSSAPTFDSRSISTLHTNNTKLDDSDFESNAPYRKPQFALEKKANRLLTFFKRFKIPSIPPINNPWKKSDQELKYKPKKRYPRAVVVLFGIVVLVIVLFIVLFFSLIRKTDEVSPTAAATPTGRSSVSVFAGTGNTGIVDGDRQAASFGAFLHAMRSDANQNIWITDGELRVLRGNTVRTYFNSTLFSPTGLVISNQFLFVADPQSRNVYRIDTSNPTDRGIVYVTSNRTVANNFGLSFFEFNRIERMSVRNNNLFFSDSVTHLVVRMDLRTHVFQGVAGQRNVAGATNAWALNATLNQPTGIVHDSTGNLYICDSGNSKIRKFGTNAIVTDFIGSVPGTQDGVGTQALIDQPRDILFHEGYLYFTDKTTVRKANLEGMVTTIAKVDDPTGLVILGNSLLVMERANRLILKLDNVFT